MERNDRDAARGAQRGSGDRLYALLCRVSEQVRDVDLQVRALNRRLDAEKNEKKGG